MADIELVVKMPEEIRLALINNIQLSIDQQSICDSYIKHAIINGTPLPKGHGRLINVDEVIKIANKTKDLHGAIWNAQTIIEADKESEDKENKNERIYKS